MAFELSTARDSVLSTAVTAVQHGRWQYHRVAPYIQWSYRHPDFRTEAGNGAPTRFRQRAPRHPRAGRPGAQSQERRRRPAAQFPVGADGAERVRQVVAGVRHHLRRGPAPLRREPVRLRPAVSRTDAEAGRRPDRGAVAGDLDRAEDHLAQPALDGRNGHRDLRLPAPAVRPCRHPLLAGDRVADREPDGQPDGRPHPGAAGGHPPLPPGPDRARQEGRVPQGTGGSAQTRLPARAGRRRASRDRGCPGARQEAQARHRGGGRPFGGAGRNPDPAGRFDRDRARPVGRAAVRRRRRFRGPPHLLGQVRLPGVRLHDRRDRAPAVLVQQPVRRLPGVRRSRHHDVLRSRAGDSESDAVAARRCRCPLGGQFVEVLRPDPVQPGQAFRRVHGDAVAGPAGGGAPGDPARHRRGAGHHDLRGRAAGLQDREAVRGRGAEHAAALARDRQRLGARGTRPLPVRSPPARPATASG